MKKILPLLIFCAASLFSYAQPPCPGVFPVAPFETTKMNPPLRDPNNSQVPPPVLPADRIIYWVHGLGGETKNWHKAGLYSKEIWEIHSFYPDYSDTGMNEAADDLQVFMDTEGDEESQEQGITDLTDNFVIGHSQGGIVPRALDKRITEFYGEDERKFGGVVSFGSPHQGAQILNNVDPFGLNMLTEWATDGCEDLLAGPTLELQEDLIEAINDAIPGIIKFFIGGLGNEDINLAPIPGLVCEEAIPTVIPIVFQDYNTGITDDYNVGATYINELNAFHADPANDKIERIAFYGIEEEPVLWRTVSSFAAPPGGTPEENPTHAPVFTANSDKFFVDKANDLELNYISHVEEHNSAIEHLEDFLGHFSWWNPPPPPLVWAIQDAIQEHQSMRDAWQEGLYWLQNANNSYKAIIGGYEVNPVWEGQCFCTVTYDEYGVVYVQPIGADNPTDCELASQAGNGWTYECDFDVTNFQWEIIDRPSDGVVLAESAANMPGQTFIQDPNTISINNPDDPLDDVGNLFLMKRSNHIQMRNDVNTQTALENVFNGKVGENFKTDKR